MVYGIAKMLNFAHGDVIMIGAYIAFCAMQYWGFPPILSVLAAMVVCTVLGMVILALTSLLTVLLLRGIQEPVRVVQRRHLWTEMAEGAVFVAGDVYSLRYERIGLSASGVGMTMGFLGLGMFVGLSARPK